MVTPLPCGLAPGAAAVEGSHGGEGREGDEDVEVPHFRGLGGSWTAGLGGELGLG